MPTKSQVNKRYSTNKLRITYAHAGVYDLADKQVWIAKKRWGSSAVRVSHARLLTGGKHDESTSAKDRFICYTYHTPDSGEGYVQGYPIEWEEAHLFIRLNPAWNYTSAKLIPATDSAKIEKNIERQFGWARRIYQIYLATGPTFPLSWHMIGPNPTDSMFYIDRYEPS